MNDPLHVDVSHSLRGRQKKKAEFDRVSSEEVITRNEHHRKNETILQHRLCISTANGQTCIWGFVDNCLPFSLSVCLTGRSEQV